MSLHKLAVLTVAVLTVGGVVPARAQSPARPPSPSSSPQNTWRFRASINYGVQPSPISFNESVTDSVFLETATLTASYKVEKGMLFGGGFAMRVMGNLGVGAAVSSYSAKNDASVTISVPHPFFFNTPRSDIGVAVGAKRNETIVHVQAVYIINPGSMVEVAVSGGPSFFSVKQDLVTDVTYDDEYPFDTLTFGTTSTATVSKTGIGYHAGVDVGVRLTERFGAGGMVRYTKATMAFPLPDGAGTVTSAAGGLQVGGGLRLYF